MRDIKFRAWDKLRKRMSEVDRIYVDTRGVQLRDDFGLYWREINDVILEQYTRLKDKNGTEIYEGDIIKVERDGTIYRVEWIHGGFGLEPRYNAPYYPRLGNVGLREKIKVIGNIHEVNKEGVYPRE